MFCGKLEDAIILKFLVDDVLLYSDSMFNVFWHKPLYLKCNWHMPEKIFPIYHKQAQF